MHQNNIVEGLIGRYYDESASPLKELFDALVILQRKHLDKLLYATRSEYWNYLRPRLEEVERLLKQATKLADPLYLGD